MKIMNLYPTIITRYTVPGHFSEFRGLPGIFLRLYNYSYNYNTINVEVKLKYIYI